MRSPRRGRSGASWGHEGVGDRETEERYLCCREGCGRFPARLVWGGGRARRRRGNRLRRCVDGVPGWGGGGPGGRIGGSAPSRQNRAVMARPYTSARWSAVPAARLSSGAPYSQLAATPVPPATLSGSLARSKSPRRAVPSPSRRMFCGFTSRWRIPCWFERVDPRVHPARAKLTGEGEHTLLVGRRVVAVADEHAGHRRDP